MRSKEPIPIQRLEEIINGKEQRRLRADILTILAHWSNMALAIKANVADEKTAYDLVAGTLTCHVAIFRPFIAERRKINPRAYTVLLELEGRWKFRIDKETLHEDYDEIIPKEDRQGKNITIKIKNA